jgi:putative membrane protein
MPFVQIVTRMLTAGCMTVALAACGEGDGSNEELGQASPPVPGDSAVMSTTEPAQLTDGDIAAILAASDTAEIAPSQTATDAATSPEITSFAAMMIRDHGMLSDSLRALAEANGIAPTPNTLSEQLHTQTLATAASLRGLSGAAFDSAYAAAMMQSHEAALNAIDSQLLPAAENAELRSALERKVRPTVAAHLEQIQQLQATLGAQ